MRYLILALVLLTLPGCSAFLACAQAERCLR
jgi:hypothetical protein